MQQKPASRAKPTVSKYAKKKFERTQGQREAFAFQEKPKHTQLGISKASPTDVIRLKIVVTRTEPTYTLIRNKKLGIRAIIHGHFMGNQYPTMKLAVNDTLDCTVKLRFTGYVVTEIHT